MTRVPKIAVVIGTRNRAGLLKRALAGLLEQTLAPELFEVVVVDNGSSDNTRTVFEQVAANAGPVTLRYCFEPNLGISFARNRGLTETEAPMVAYLDDDAFAEPGWLQALVTGFELEPRRPLCVGGEIVLDWEGPQPAWLPEFALGLLGRLDHGAVRRTLKFPKKQLFGSNMAFERAYLAEIGGFDTRLGRKGNNLISNEETALMWRLAAEGGHLLYEPAAVVRHWVPKERARLSWFLRRFYAQGATDVIDAKIRQDTGLAKPKKVATGDEIATGGSLVSEKKEKRRKRRRSSGPEKPRGVLPRAVRLGRRLGSLVKQPSQASAIELLFALAYDAGTASQHARRRLGRG